MDKSHRYVLYSINQNEEGQWSYDKKNKTITFQPDNDTPVTYHVVELDKKNFSYERLVINAGHEYIFRFSYSR